MYLRIFVRNNPSKILSEVNRETEGFLTGFLKDFWQLCLKNPDKKLKMKTVSSVEVFKDLWQDSRRIVLIRVQQRGSRITDRILEAGSSWGPYRGVPETLKDRFKTHSGLVSVVQDLLLHSTSIWTQIFEDSFRNPQDPLLHSTPISIQLFEDSFRTLLRLSEGSFSYRISHDLQDPPTSLQDPSQRNTFGILTLTGSSAVV